MARCGDLVGGKPHIDDSNAAYTHGLVDNIVLKLSTRFDVKQIQQIRYVHFCLCDKTSCPVKIARNFLLFPVNKSVGKFHLSYSKSRLLLTHTYYMGT